MNTTSPTKEKILIVALTLFSQKGYSAVLVNDIAKAVGIKAPSLYKHYKSKQEIFNSCVEVFSQRMNNVRTKLKLPETSQASVEYKSASMETILYIANDLFSFYLYDEVASNFRKILMIERYHNEELNKIFEELFIEGAVKHEEKIFKQLIKSKIIKNENPHIIALRFYTPIFYLLQKYDTAPQKINEAKKELTSIVKEFCKTYGYNQENEE